MEELEIQKMFYFPVCSKEEIERIFEVKNTADYLLKLRADTVVDHMRLFRVMRNRALRNEKDWTLTGAFNQLPFSKYVSSLPESQQKKCAPITAGFIFSNDPNGSCMRTEYGDIIVVSIALEYFLNS